MPRPRTQSDDDVLDAVGRVLRSVGPHALTFRLVASEAGLAPATLVQRFGNRRAMLLAFSERAARTVLELDGQPSHASASERIVRLLARLAADLTSHEELVHGLAMLVEDMRDEGLRSAARAHADAIERRVEALLREAVASAELRAHDTRSMAKSLVATYNGALIGWGLRGEGSSADAIADAVSPILSALTSLPLRSGEDEPPKRRRPPSRRLGRPRGDS